MVEQKEKIDASKEPVSVKGLDFFNAFNQLNDEEKLYTYYFYKASWEGFPIVLFQMSPNGPLLFVLFQKFFSSFNNFNEIKELIASKTSEKDADEFLEYAATIYDNAGMYRSFGFDKIYCEVSQENFEKILKLSNDESVIEIYTKLADSIFDRSESTKSINLYEKGGVTAYYLGGIKEEEIKKVDEFLAGKNISPLNTRLIKFSNNDKDLYAYLVGSIDNKIIDNGNGIFGVYGDFDSFLVGINDNLEKCKKYTKREFQLRMIEKYLESFKLGDIEAHKQSQIEWIKDIKPVVETNIGWIETYVDPIGVRAYYEGFVALVDKENTKKFTELVNSASELLSPKNIPWPEDFENYPFKEPDYTQIDMVAFASDGCPMGINIPNYDDIREAHGFKNVTIGNNLPSFKASNMKFMTEKDKPVIEKYGLIGTIIHTGCHELLGHGSGKLLRENEDGTFNFKKGELKYPNSDKEVCYYKKGENFENIFTDIGRSYEECRADISGLFFGKSKLVTSIFGIKEEEIDDVVFAKWTTHLRKGLLGSKYFNTTTKKWGQAHVQGAYVFFQFIKRNQMQNNPIVTIELKDEDFVIKVDKHAIKEYGHNLVSKLLLSLNIWKSTASIKEARDFYESHSEVDEEILKLREIVIKHTPKRGLTVNHNLKLNESTGKIEIIEYEENCLGIIKSYIDRYGNDTNDKILKQYYKWDKINDVINK